MTTDLAVRDPSAVAMTRRGVNMQSRNDVVWLATVATEAQPQRWKRTADAALAIVVGMEAGLSPAQALQKLYVVNGKVAMETEAAMAIVRQSSVYKSLSWRYEGEPGTDGFTCICTGQRNDGSPPVDSSLSIGEAKQAGLLTKSDPWKRYTRRMLFARAMGWLLRDLFPDALAGLAMKEEVQDYTVGHEPAARQAPTEPIEDPLLADEDEPGDADGGVVDAEYVKKPRTQESEPEPAEESITLNVDSSPQAEEGGAPVEPPTDAPADKGVGAETPPPASADGKLTFWQKRLKDVRKAVGAGALLSAARHQGYEALADLAYAPEADLKAICTLAEDIKAGGCKAARNAIPGLLSKLEEDERDALWQVHGMSPDELEHATDEAIRRLHDDLVGLVLKGE